MERIVIATSTLDLCGKGTEYLVDSQGQVICKFIDGQLVRYPNIAPDSESTI